MLETDVVIYQNGHADKKTKALVESLPIGIRKVDSIKLLLAINPFPKKIAVAGGEGTFRPLTEMMRDKDAVTPILLLGGGTQNVLFNELRRRDHAITVEQFMDTPLDKLTKDFSFHPGQAFGQKDSTIFNNQYAFGAFERTNGTLNQALRIFPRKWRPLLVRGLAATIAMFGDSQKIDMFSVTPCVGNVRAFPSQDLFGPNITHARILPDRNASIKLALVLLYWCLKKPVPENILTVTQRSEFNYITQHTPKVWIDGDTDTNYSEPDKYGNMEVVIKRSELAVPIVALV